MNAATSAVVKEEHQRDACMYCGAKFTKKWETVVSHGLERKINHCDECGKEARKKVSKHLDIHQFFKAHSLDWGDEVRTNTNY
ncbi:MAG: hypothetical protein V3V78_00630 [Candidatus Woesearchaeota archaeon]